MFENAREAAACLRRELQALEGAGLSGPEAAEAVSAFARVAKLAQAGLTLAAGALEEASTQALAGSRHRSARDYVSAKAGVSSSAAEGMVDLAERLRRHPSITSFLVSGDLSVSECAEIARAADRRADATQA